MHTLRLGVLFFLMFLTTVLFAGTTGKISGRVTDSQSGEPLAGVNVYVESTMQGAATDADGYYFIINIKPGSYKLTFSYVGYRDYVVENVNVNSDLTTIINAKLNPEIMTTEAVVVVAKKPVVQKDMAASMKNISADEVKALPVTSIAQVVGLQAGVTSDLSIRGSSSSQMLFMVDGISFRDTRNNEPIMGIPLSALEEVSVQSGGLGAEYDNVRSGVVNVVTKEGSKNSYSGTITYKVRPPQPKHFGISPFDPNSYWFRPYLDDAVAWTGTENGAWDEYTRRQYPKFSGWNSIALQTLQDSDPTNDLTPEAAQRIFLWQHRKQGDIKKPDYDIDAGFGGPVPFISKSLGDLRFYASYKRNQDMYLYHLATDALSTETFMLRLTSDITPSIKLTLMGLSSNSKGTAISRTGGTALFSSTWSVANAVNSVGFTAPWRLYTDIYFSTAYRYANIFSAKLTYVVSPKTFWVAKFISTNRRYKTGPDVFRDTTKKYELFEGYYVDEAPVGYYPYAISSVEGRLGMGGAVSVGRDTSTITTYQLKYDLTSQINRHNQIKAGVQVVSENYDLGFGMVNKFLPEGNTWSRIKQHPYRGVVYAQDKIEYEGFIANLGLIMDYYNFNGKWYQASTFDRDFYSDNYSDEDEARFKNKNISPRITISPRLSISHPITENSKLFFNYGHYHEMPTSERFYRVQRDIRNKLDQIGDPTIPLSTTVAYELGYDQALLNSLLLRVAAYYKDILDEEFWVRYISFDGKVNYLKITNNGYEDIRGIELDLTKRSGKWVTGNINYEYRVGTSGYFETARVYENPADQREYERRNAYQFKPRPQPRIKSYIDFHTPPKFGPQTKDAYLLADWHFNLIANWRSGSWDTWNPNKIPGIRYNIQWKDYYMADLRISRTFKVKNFDLKFFADFYNVFNLKHFSGVSFSDIHDYEYYMKSLHLPTSITNELNYGAIPGDDQPGDYRPSGVAYQPMQWTADITNITDPNPRVIYYDGSTSRYMQINADGQWQVVQGSALNKILDDKAYIDMPNQTYFTFLNPRNIFMGLTLTYHF